MDNLPGSIQEGRARLLAGAEPDEPTAEIEEEEIPTEVPPVVEGDVIPEGDDVQVSEEPEGQPEVTYDVGGEQVSLEDLRLGYMKDADYRQKTMALAEQRKVDDAQREEFQQKLEIAREIGQLEKEDFESAENLELKEYDPAAYYAKKERFEARQKRLDDMGAESKRLSEEAEATHVAEEGELLIPAIPEWVDQEVLQTEIQLCQDLWSRLGFTGDDLKKYNDHRLIVISRKAALYDRMMNAKPEDKKVTTKPKSAQPGTTTTGQDRATANRKSAQDKFRQSGKLKDAMGLLTE